MVSVGVSRLDEVRRKIKPVFDAYYIYAEEIGVDFAGEDGQTRKSYLIIY